MKVFVVTAGEYSDYHIEKVFTDRIKAHMYSLMGSEYEYRQVEEYEVDEIDVDVKSKHLRIVYDYNSDRIVEILINDCEINTRRVTDDWYRVEFTIPLTNEKVYKSVCRYGKNSGLIKRITEDTFARFLYENDLSREDLINKESDRLHNRAIKHQYMFYTTSPVTEMQFKDGKLYEKQEADSKATAILKLMAQNQEIILAEVKKHEDRGD